jgi:hypothetical protein
MGAGRRHGVLKNRPELLSVQPAFPSDEEKDFGNLTEADQARGKGTKKNEKRRRQNEEFSEATLPILKIMLLFFNFPRLSLKTEH